MSPSKERALQALLTCPTKGEAAQTAGISSRTLTKYLQDEEFQQAYRAASDVLLAEASRQAQLTISPALQTLQEIMMDPGTADAARISAARSLLDFALRIAETVDLARRLADLEGRTQWET